GSWVRVPAGSFSHLHLAPFLSCRKKPHSWKMSIERATKGKDHVERICISLHRFGRGCGDLFIRSCEVSGEDRPDWPLPRRSDRQTFPHRRRVTAGNDGECLRGG